MAVPHMSRPHPEERPQDASRRMATHSIFGPSFETGASRPPQDEVGGNKGYPSRLYLAQRGHLELILMISDGAGDETRGDRRAVVVQDRHQPDRIDTVLVDDQRTQLRVAVLLDHINEVVLGEEACDA